MNALIDFIPVLLFFIAYKLTNVFVATAVTMASSALLLLWAWLKKHPISNNQWITFAMIILLGLATLWFHDDQYIKWKPTAVYWLLAMACLFTQVFSKKVLVQRLMGQHMTLPHAIWKKLNMSWVGFFGFMGALNVYVFSHYDTNAWVNFKLFGALGLTFVFIMAQAIWINKHQVRN
jgi:intracellular septation protein